MSLERDDPPKPEPTALENAAFHAEMAQSVVDRDAARGLPVTLEMLIQLSLAWSAVAQAQALAGVFNELASITSPNGYSLNVRVQ